MIVTEPWFHLYNDWYTKNRIGQDPERAQQTSATQLTEWLIESSIIDNMSISETGGNLGLWEIRLNRGLLNWQYSFVFAQLDETLPKIITKMFKHILQLNPDYQKLSELKIRMQTWNTKNGHTNIKPFYFNDDMSWLETLMLDISAKQLYVRSELSLLVPDQKRANECWKKYKIKDKK